MSDSLAYFSTIERCFKTSSETLLPPGEIPEVPLPHYLPQTISSHIKMPIKESINMVNEMTLNSLNSFLSPDFGFGRAFIILCTF